MVAEISLSMALVLVSSSVTDSPLHAESLQTKTGWKGYRSPPQPVFLWGKTLASGGERRAVDCLAYKC